MRNLVKYVGIGLLVMGLAACDNSDSKAPTVGAAAESNASGQAISLLDGKLSFTLPAGMADQSGKLGTQANNMHGHTLQQLDSIISAKGQTAWSSVILGKVDDKLLTLQVTLPADNQQQAQTEAESIINTLTIQ